MVAQPRSEKTGNLQARCTIFTEARQPTERGAIPPKPGILRDYPVFMDRCGMTTERGPISVMRRDRAADEPDLRGGG